MKSFLILGFLLFHLSAQATESAYTVGVVFRLGDQYNSTVGAMIKGIKVAKELFEKQNPGSKIDLKMYSHETSLASVDQVSKTIAADGVKAVIGGELSEEAMALGDSFEKKKIVFITPTSTSPVVTHKKEYTFRGCFSDAQVAEQIARFVAKKIKPERVGVIHNISSPYSDFLSRKFVETYSKLNPSQATDSLLVEKVVRNSQDFSAQVRKFKAANVTHVVMLTHESDVDHFISQAAAQDYHPTYVGSDGWGSNQFVMDALISKLPDPKKFVVYRYSYWNDKLDSPFRKQFDAQYKKDYPGKPNAYSAIAFDTAWVLFSAMKKVQAPITGPALKTAMIQTQNLDLVTTNNFSFDSEHSPKRGLNIFKLTHRGAAYETTVQ